VVRFAVNPGEDFYSQPFPCDLRLGDATGIDLTGFPPGEVVVNKMVAAASAYSDGFAVGGVVFFAFSANVDEDSLPAMGAQSMAESSSVFIVDVDPSSPERGTRVPLWLRYKDAPSRFLPANWLGLLPYPGVPLRPGTTYAAVVTRQVRLAEGPSFGPDEDLDAILNDDPRPELSRGRQVFGPLLDWLDEEGLDRSQVAGATVFTTRSSASLLSAARAVIHRDLPLPTLSDLVLVNETANYHLYEGTYQAPIFQQGEPPYRTAGGQIEVDQGGDPVLVRMETLRVGISVPRDVMPSAGWPVAIYRHGTGGDYLSFVSDGTADRLAKAIDSSFQVIGRAAVISIDGVVHGPRAGEDEGSPEERFYNFGNPLAGRDNSRQEAIDNFQLVRLAQSVDVAAAPETGEPIRFDPDGITFFGHSQGAITGALFVPFEPELAAAVLSGAGAHLLLTLLRKESGLDIPTLLELILNDGDYGPIDEFHPVLTLVQTYIEPADPLAYTRYYLREPPEGVGPRNLFLSYGVGDSYTPNITTRVLAAAAGLGPAGSVIDPYEAMELYGEVTPLSPPVCQNLNGAAGPSTAVVVQYQPRYGDDGHFVVFDHMVAKRQSAGFLVTATSTLSATEFEGCATLIP
jgi:predicted esterase